MYKVVLVDDEAWILLGLKKAFKWEDFGFTVIAETDNSLEALSIIYKHKPDLIVTDIRMPEISGLDLIRKVREHALETEFIVLSGFAEFSFAQEAIKLGAFDYWLKPFKIDEAQKTLDRLFNHIKHKKSAEDILLFDMFINSNEGWFTALCKRGLESKETYYQIAILINHANQSGCKSMQMIDGKSFIRVGLGLNKEFYVINTSSDISTQAKLMDGTTATVGLSGISQNVCDIPSLFIQADIAVQSAYISKKIGFFAYKPRKTDYLNKVIEILTIELENKNYVEVFDQLDKIALIYSDMNLSLEDIAFLWNRLATYILGKYGKSPFVDEIGFVEYDEIISKFNSVEIFINNVKEMIQFISSDLPSKNDYINENFNKLLEYIEQNFYKKLVLKDLCDMYFINLNYCCELFKKVKEVTFSDYVTGLRMKKTVELMKSTDLSIEDIAYESGYNDYYYFNRIFSKHYGISPARYRKNISESK